MTSEPSRTEALAAFRRLADDFTKISQGKSTKLELVALLIEPVEPPPAAAPGAGWVREASEVRRCKGNEELLRPLSGEWCMGDTVGIMLRSGVPQPGKTSAWQLSHRPLGQDGELQAGEVPTLRERVTVLEAISGELSRSAIAKHKDATELPILAYDIYWGSDASDAAIVRRVACRFAGFANEAGHVLPPPDSRQRWEG